MSATVTHTFLLQPARWQASGWYRGQNGDVFPVSGETRISHRAELWLNEGEMRLDGGPAFVNRYEVTPFRANTTETVWRSQSRQLGAMQGRFILVGAAILSPYRSVDGLWFGNETLLKLSDNHYRVLGTLLNNNLVNGAWEVVRCNPQGENYAK